MLYDKTHLLSSVQVFVMPTMPPPFFANSIYRISLIGTRTQKTPRPRIQDYRGLLTNLIERALVYNAHLLITDDYYQCLWCCNSFLSK